MEATDRVARRQERLHIESIVHAFIDGANLQTGHGKATQAVLRRVLAQLHSDAARSNDAD